MKDAIGRISIIIRSARGWWISSTFGATRGDGDRLRKRELVRTFEGRPNQLHNMLPTILLRRWFVLIIRGRFNAYTASSVLPLLLALQLQAGRIA